MSPQVQQIVREFETQLEAKRKIDNEVYQQILGNKFKTNQDEYSNN